MEFLKIWFLVIKSLFIMILILCGFFVLIMPMPFLVTHHHDVLALIYGILYASLFISVCIYSQM